ncbi:MAG: radical SAM protein [Patescibacteria group bacterium]
MQKTIKKIISEILVLVTNLSDKNLIRIINLIQKNFLKDAEFIQGAEKMKNEIRAGETKSKFVLLRKIFRSLSKNAQRKIVENFLLNESILGRLKRRQVLKKFGINPPWTMVISPTARCNLRCRGCYAGEYNKEHDLPYSEVDRILTEAKELAIYYVTISGGEPFFWPHLLEMFAKHNDVYFQIYTNGTLIDKKTAKKLAELGNVMLGISVEGFEAETDNRRGKGTFAKVMEAMDNLREAGVLFGFSATPTKFNSELIMSDKFIDFYINKGCAFGWYFQYVPIGVKPDVQLMSRPEQRNKLRLRVNEIREQKPIFIGDFWNDGQHVGGCIAAARPGGYFHINCRGDVEPCVFLQFSVDNIKGKKLIDVIQSDFFKAFQKAQPYCANGNLLTPCALIDNPQILREIVKKYNAKPSYPSGEKIINDPEITNFLDNYSKEYKKIVDPIWEKELKAQYPCWKDKNLL